MVSIVKHGIDKATGLELLRDGKNLIEHPLRWTSGAYGLDAHGDEVGCERIETAVCFCTLGAVMRAAVDLNIHFESRNQLERSVCGFMNMHFPRPSFEAGTVAEWNDNDNRTHGEVIEAFQRAIQKLETESP